MRLNDEGEGDRDMWSDTAKLLRKAQRRLWMKYALRGVGGNDNHARLELAYRMPDPWNMESPMERARFEATNRVIEQAFGRVGSVLEQVGRGDRAHAPRGPLRPGDVLRAGLRSRGPACRGHPRPAEDLDPSRRHRLADRLVAR